MAASSDIHQTAVVETDRVAADVAIGAYAVVGRDVILDTRVRIYPGVVIMGHVRIGAGTEVFPGAVIGKPTATGIALSRPQARGGPVCVGERCSIGAHVVIPCAKATRWRCIARATATL